MSTAKSQFINCHTHIFIGESIPPHLAKTFLPDPLYRWLNIRLVLAICRWWFLNKKTSPRQWKHKWWYKKLEETFVVYRSFISRYRVTSILTQLINLVIAYHAIAYLSMWLMGFFIKPDPKTQNIILKGIHFLKENKLLFFYAGDFVKIITVLFTFFFIEYGRKLMLFILKKMFIFLSILPNKKTIEFLGRYVNIRRYAYYKEQTDLF